jgi:hypothetical protein
MKKCYKCQEVKNESEFHKDRTKKDGLDSCCKECKKQYDKERDSKPERKEKRKQYDSKPEAIEKRKQYGINYNANPENKEKIKQSNKKWRDKLENRDYNRQWESIPENRKKRRQREKERRRTEPCYKLRKTLSGAIAWGLKHSGGSKRGSSILSKLPYTMQELKQHLESLFESWMNWENHGSYDPNRRTWQIDHIKPHSIFHYTDMNCQEFKDCWSLSNLRPLESLANIKKGNKLI